MNQVEWQSPSNIAIVKYWGKHGRQLPNNTSISFTLSQAHTVTKVIATPKKIENSVSLDFLFQEEPMPAFEKKISTFLRYIGEVHFPYIFNHHFEIRSSNTFPHSSGIASSASSMSALALCLVDLHRQLTDYKYDENSFYSQASTIARLGSGSACRSLFPVMGLWGYHPDIDHSSDGYAIDISPKAHDVFKSFHDDILIISGDEKSVSSTVGHSLMQNNPYADARYDQANKRCITLLKALQTGDIDEFGKICEDEAMTLHALMMCSDPSFILMKPNSLIAIEKIRNFRRDTGLNLYFTLDAGPNVHLLYPHDQQESIHAFIESELLQLCHEQKVIKDFVGFGPKKIY
jgi:diphosphomevalonate decarboxylase